ncbi:MAG: aldo/keto reductase [Brevinema sp.]
MNYVTLNNGLKMPILGFGVFQVPEPEACEKAVLDAIEEGYRLIDTAASYQNEESVGNAIKKSGVAREEMFITTKVWVQDVGYEATKKAFEKSLNNLGLDYLDLYLIHQPFGDIHGAWRAMEELYNAGKIKAIGVSNFHNDRVMDMIANNKIAPMINQIETHPFYQRIEEENFLKENGVQIQSWGPFAEGKNNLFQNEQLLEIGNQYGKSVAQVVLRWLVQRNVVVIPKSVNKDRIQQNFEVFDFELSEKDMNTIKIIDLNESLFFSHRDPEIVRRLSTYKIH